MLTAQDAFDFHKPEGTPTWEQVNDQAERQSWWQTAKEVNEQIWENPTDTLRTILGTEPGTKAKTYNSTTEIWTIVEQHRNNRCDLYWVHYEEGKGCDPTKLEDFDFKNIAFFYDVNEPIWMTA